MKYARKTYIEFLSSLMPSGKWFLTRKVKTRDISKVNAPGSQCGTIFGFRFFDILSVVVDVDGKKVQLTSERINVSPLHYYGGKLYTVAELKREFPDERILIRNIEGNGYKKAIRYRTGGWHPLKETDIFVAGTL